MFGGADLFSGLSEEDYAFWRFGFKAHFNWHGKLLWLEDNSNLGMCAFGYDLIKSHLQTGLDYKTAKGEELWEELKFIRACLRIYDFYKEQIVNRSHPNWKDNPEVEPESFEELQNLEAPVVAKLWKMEERFHGRMGAWLFKSETREPKVPIKTILLRSMSDEFANLCPSGRDRAAALAWALEAFDDKIKAVLSHPSSSWGLI